MTEEPTPALSGFLGWVQLRIRAAYMHERAFHRATALLLDARPTPPALVGHLNRTFEASVLGRLRTFPATLANARAFALEYHRHPRYDDAGSPALYERLITYTLPFESGASLRAAGWTRTGESAGGTWGRAMCERCDHHPLEPKLRWEIDLIAFAAERRRKTVKAYVEATIKNWPARNKT